MELIKFTSCVFIFLVGLTIYSGSEKIFVPTKDFLMGMSAHGAQVSTVKISQLERIEYQTRLEHLMKLKEKQYKMEKVIARWIEAEEIRWGLRQNGVHSQNILPRMAYIDYLESLNSLIKSLKTFQFLFEAYYLQDDDDDGEDFCKTHFNK